MPTVEKQLQTQIANIERSSGLTMAEWRTQAAARGLTKHGQIVEPLSRCVETPSGSLIDQAAWTSSLGGSRTRIPSANRTPARTRVMTVAPPLRTRQCWPRRSTILNTR